MIDTESLEQNFQTAFRNSAVSALSDTTVDRGDNSGFRPHELLEAALASCMNITLRRAAKKHHIPLEEHQRKALLAVVEHCPVRETLSKEIRFQRN